MEFLKGIIGLAMWAAIGSAAWWFFWGRDTVADSQASIGRVQDCEVAFLENTSSGAQRRLRAFVFSGASTQEDRIATAVAAALNLRSLAEYDYAAILLTPTPAPRDRNQLPLSSARIEYAPDPDVIPFADVVWQGSATGAAFSDDFAFASQVAYDADELALIASTQTDLSACEVSLNWTDGTPEGFDWRDLSTEAAIICQNFVDAALVAPSTADHPWLDRQIVERGAWSYTVRSYVDAQNSFDATVRSNYLCNIEYRGEGDALDPRSWSLEALEFQG